MKYVILAVLALFSSMCFAGTELTCINDDGTYVVMDNVNDDSVLIDDDKYNVLYDKTDGDVHFTKFLNEEHNQLAYLIVHWGSSGNVEELLLVTMNAETKAKTFEGTCSTEGVH